MLLLLLRTVALGALTLCLAALNLDRTLKDGSSWALHQHRITLALPRDTELTAGNSTLTL